MPRLPPGSASANPRQQRPRHSARRTGAGSRIVNTPEALTHGNHMRHRLQRNLQCEADAEDVDNARGLSTSSAVVFALEIPLEDGGACDCHVSALRRVHDSGSAPVAAGGMPRALYGVDLLTPNQVEAEALWDWILRAMRCPSERRPQADRQRIAGPRGEDGGAEARPPWGAAGGSGRDDPHDQAAQGEDRRYHRRRRRIHRSAGRCAYRGDGPCPSVAFCQRGRGGVLRGFGAQPALPAREAVERLLEE